MRFFEKKNHKFLCLSIIFGVLGLLFVGNGFIQAALSITKGSQGGQTVATSSTAVQSKSGGLAAARERERAARDKSGVPIKGGQYTKKPLSDALKAELQKEQEALDLVPIGQPGQPAVVEEEQDEYTQSEAHMQLDEVKKLMAEFPLYAEGAILKEGEVKLEKTPNEIVAPYLNVVAAALNKEVELKNSHYVFYHGQTNQWRVPQDLYKLLYAYYNPLKPVKDFSFIRFTDMQSITAQNYLSGHVQEFAGVNDNKDKTILAVNLALFGNVGFPGECTWNYFQTAKSHRWPFPENYLAILDAFGLSYNIDELVKEADALAEMLSNASQEQDILQIFIPQEKVDEIGFLAWILGFPAHPKSMELIEKIIGNRPKVGNITGPAVRKVMKRFKREGEDNPVYQELIEAVENGDFGIEAFLKVYRNTPWKLQNVNDTQARLVITNEGLLNPESGVKFFSYYTTPRDVQEAYLKRVEALARKIIDQNKAKEQNK